MSHIAAGFSPKLNHLGVTLSITWNSSCQSQNIANWICFKLVSFRLRVVWSNCINLPRQLNRVNRDHAAGTFRHPITSASTIDSSCMKSPKICLIVDDTPSQCNYFLISIEQTFWDNSEFDTDAEFKSESGTFIIKYYRTVNCLIDSFAM